MSKLAHGRASRVGFVVCAQGPEYCADFRVKGGPSQPPEHSGRRPNDRRFRPGDTIRQSGIYEIIHDHDHRPAHEAVMISGESFPDCDTCKNKVRFRLVRTAPYIFQDEDFEDDAG
jgi:hypothetical protein